jgi:hypothetical protein
MIIQPTTDTSVVAKLVAVAVRAALITKEVDAMIVPTVSSPRAAAPVAPIDCLQITIREFAVTAVVETVAVPPTRVTLPKLLAPAVIVVPTLVERILLPAVPRTRLPLVAVIAPNVAVREVVAVKEPVTAVLPVALPRLVAPVPPVPIDVTPAPDVLIFVVPVIAAPPELTVSPPAVAVRPVEAVKDPVTCVFPEALPI